MKIRQCFLLLLLALVLLLSIPLSITVEASEYGGVGESGSSDLSGAAQTKDGFSYARSGFLIYTTDKDGNLTSKVVSRSLYGVKPSSNYPILDLLTTRFGGLHIEEQYDNANIAWGVPPFNNDGSGNGRQIKDWMLQPYQEYDYGVEFVLSHYLGFSKEQVLEWDKNKDNRLNIEGWLLGGYFKGSTHTGLSLLGTVTTFAKLNTSKDWGARLTHNALANGMYHNEQVYTSLPVPSDVTNKHDSNTILSHAYDIVTIKPDDLNADIQVVRVYMDGNVLENTTYSYETSPVSIKDEPQYKMEKYHSSEKKTERNGLVEYEIFETENPPVQSGTSPTELTVEPPEEAVFILYKKESNPVTIVDNADAIRAHELNYIFESTDGIRSESGYSPNLLKYKISMDNFKPGNATAWNPKDVFLVNESLSGKTASSGRPVLYYNPNLGVYKAKAEVKEFGRDTEIIPSYAVNVSRVGWEPNLKLSNYKPENDALVLEYANTVLGIASDNRGTETLVDTGVNVENLFPDSEENTFKFSATFNADMTLEENSRQVTDESGNTSTVYDYNDYNKDYSEDIVEYNMSTSCYKFKVIETPVASISSLGDIIGDSKRGNDILRHDVITKQIVSTQVKKVLNFFPEVQYTLWYTGDLSNFNIPVNKPVYVMGEYARKTNAPILHGYYTRVSNGSSLKGSTDVAAPSTGSFADELYDYYLDKGYNALVTAQGTTFNTFTSNSIVVSLGTVALNCTDAYGVKVAWGNDDYIPEDYHNQVVSYFQNNLEANLYMQPFDSNIRKKFDHYVLSTTSNASAKITDEKKESVNIIFKEGKIQNIGILKAKIQEYLNPDDVDAVWNNWNLEKLLDDMYVSCTDPEKYNNSGNDLSESSAIRRYKWYDEESITMTLDFYKTDLDMGKLVANDKLEYGFLVQDKYSRYNRGTSDSLLMKFFYRVNFIDDDNDGEFIYHLNGSKVNHTSTLYFNEVKGAEVILSNETTSNMIK